MSHKAAEIKTTTKIHKKRRKPEKSMNPSLTSASQHHSSDWILSETQSSHQPQNVKDIPRSEIDLVKIQCWDIDSDF